MQDFFHEKLDVYKAALAFLLTADEILEEVPRGRGRLGDQLDRAATSIVLNVAEGAGDFPAPRRLASTAWHADRRTSARRSSMCIERDSPSETPRARPAASCFSASLRC